MIQKKVCLLGAFAVGKTSLVARFVHSLFDERYHTTVGVKVDKKVVALPDGEVTLVLWDLAGEAAFQRIQPAYLRGAAGYLLVADGTRAETVEEAMAIRERTEAVLGSVPFVVAVNKSDLRPEWEVGQEEIEELRRRGWRIHHTSAKDGTGVEEAFTELARLSRRSSD